eukprot:TRINITY_DN5055_c0_g1_i1.p1 TRINITY_DN5055_c0_g1~~TRINITY_DN5055_c0_g1_i1.p1  ORF type:complete len:328 (+),score=37.69 TRINITY_DN5055_c0_g1_i1:63-1046(+)
MSTYKAIVVSAFGEPAVLKVADVPVPGTISETEILVDVKFAGINPVDTYIRSGVYARSPALPYRPGGDGAGIVEKIGSDVTNVRVGDRVYLSAGSFAGVYGQKAVIPATAAHPLPDNVPFDQGAAISVPYATAYHAVVHRGNAKPGEVALVHGASGGVGTAVTQILTSLGVTVIGTAGTEQGLALVKENGAKYVFDHTKDGYEEEIRAVIGDGVDVIVEMLGNVNLERDIGLIGMNGRILVVGNRGTVEINPRGLMAKRADVRGVAMWTATADEVSEIHAFLYAGLKNGSLTPKINKRIALKDAPQSHVLVMARGALGKIVLDTSDV